jgi:hypothetical protein
MNLANIPRVYNMYQRNGTKVKQRKNTCEPTPSNFSQLPLETICRDLREDISGRMTEERSSGVRRPDAYRTVVRSASGQNSIRGMTIREGFDVPNFNGDTPDLNEEDIQDAGDKAKQVGSDIKNNQKVRDAGDKAKQVGSDIKNNQKVRDAGDKAKQVSSDIKNNQKVQDAEAKAKQLGSDIANNEKVQNAKEQAMKYASNAGQYASKAMGGLPSFSMGGGGNPNCPTGFDQSNAKEQLKAYARYFLSHLSHILDNVNPIADSLIEKITNALNLKQKENSHDVIRRNVIQVFSVFISLFVTYNWFYLMYYKKDRFHVTLSSIKNYSPLAHFFLKYNLVLMVSIDYILFDTIPYYLKTFFGLVPAFYMIWGFVHIHLVPMLANMFDNLNKALRMEKGDYDNQLVSFMVVFGLASTVMWLPPFEMLERAYKYLTAGPFVLITYILRIVLLSIPFTWVGVIITCLYLIYVSFFAIIANELYSSYQVWKQLDHFINTSFGLHEPCSGEDDGGGADDDEDEKKDDKNEKRPYNCNQCGSIDNIFTWLLKKIIKIVRFGIQFKLKHKLSFIVLLTLYYALADYIFNMLDDAFTQTFMVVVTLVIGIAVFLRVYINFDELQRMADLASKMGKTKKKSPCEDSGSSESAAFNFGFLNNLKNPFENWKGMDFGGLNVGLSQSIEHVAEAIKKKDFTSPYTGEPDVASATGAIAAAAAAATKSSGTGIEKDLSKALTDIIENDTKEKANVSVNIIE